MAQGAVTTITEPGEHSVSKKQYELDPVPSVSLRASLAWMMVNQTPAHAFWNCPRLNPEYVREEKRHFDFGTAAHEMLLGKGRGYKIIKAPDYKTKAAQMARRTVYATGLTPLLEHEEKDIQAMVRAIRRQLQDMVDAGTLDAMPFQKNETERCIVWREDNGVMCRSSLDGLDVAGEVLSEFKTEAESADPSQWQWKARKLGYPFKAAFYCRGLSKLGIAHSPTAQFIVAEKKPPYLVSLVRIDDELMMKEMHRVTEAIRLWGRCLASGRWPGYSITGYEMTLSERERQAIYASEGIGNNGHLSSDDIAASL